MNTQRCLLLSLLVLAVCATATMAQVAPTSVTQLDGTVGPTYSTLPPPNPPALDYWNRINGTGVVGSVFDGTTFSLPYTQTKPYNSFSVNTFVSGAASTLSYQGGGSKDPNLISQWAYSTSPTPDKDTFTNAYAVAYTGATVNGHTIINFGADRFSTSGDANIGIWFFQQNVGPNGSGGFSGAHQNGDIFLISAFTNGGGTSGISVFLWNQAGLPNAINGGCPNSNYPTPNQLPACAATNLLEVYNAAGNSVCGLNPTCAITNASPQTAEWPYIAKSNQNAGTNIIPSGALFTGGVDLTYIFNLVSENVPCISSFLFDTRSSQSPSAVLKDFIGGNFSLCAVGASAACTTAPTYVVGPPALINYTVNGSVTNQASGNLYGLQVTVTPPAGATNVVTTQPVTPVGGLAFGQSAAFSVTFQYPSQGAITVAGSACAAAFSGGPCTVTTQTDGTPANWSATLGTGTCSITTNPTMSLAKSCTVNLVPTLGGVILQLSDTITVKNTGTTDTITNITLTNNVTNGPSADIIVSGLTLTAGQSKTYTPNYLPTNCATGLDPAGGGRCQFTDTVSVTSVPKDEFGNPLPAAKIPAAQSATCYVCPPGACIPQ